MATPTYLRENYRNLAAGARWHVAKILRDVGGWTMDQAFVNAPGFGPEELGELAEKILNIKKLLQMEEAFLKKDHAYILGLNLEEPLYQMVMERINENNSVP